VDVDQDVDVACGGDRDAWTGALMMVLLGWNTLSERGRPGKAPARFRLPCSLFLVSQLSVSERNRRRIEIRAAESGG